MPRHACSGLLLAVLCALAAGCAGSQAIQREADMALACLSARTGGPASESTGGRPVVYNAPRQAAGGGESSPVAAAQAPAQPAGEAAGGAQPAQEFAPLRGENFGEILKNDLKAAPAALWRGTKHSFAKPQNLAILGLAFGADRVVRHNLDSDVREELRHDDTSMAETGDFGSVIGNPVLHFGIAGAWYVAGVARQDGQNHALATTMLEALAINGASTMLLKVSMNDRCPNDERYGWPSGHTSSSMCFAAVMHQYYGLKVGVPLYLLAGYSAATRLEDREHDLSDLVFGAALGLVIGHSVVKGELPQVAGFTVLPYGGPDSGGVMLVKQW